MSTLHQWAVYHGSDKGKAHQYCDFYEQRIGEPKSIIEFGVLNGASLKMWRDRYAGARVIGFDIDQKPSIPGVEIYKADCTNPASVCYEENSIDLILDDASHMINDQIKSFMLWWPIVSKGGHYVIEDIHTMHYDQYNPDKINIKAWVEAQGIKHEYYWRVPGDESDSGTLIFYK